ncbi:hypothetical protein SDB20_01890 [Legionella pneumophila serogroup 1]
MAVRSSTFSGWRLSGKDADAFEKQIKSPKPNAMAREVVVRGRPLAEEYLNKGFVRINPQNKK